MKYRWVLKNWDKHQKWHVLNTGEFHADYDIVAKRKATKESGMDFGYWNDWYDPMKKTVNRRRNSLCLTLEVYKVPDDHDYCPKCMRVREFHEFSTPTRDNPYEFEWVCMTCYEQSQKEAEEQHGSS